MLKLFTRRFTGFCMLALALVALGSLSACSVNPAGAADSLASTHTSSSHVSNANPASTFTFSMVPATGISSCLAKAHGSVTITPGSLNDTMKVSVSGLAPSTGYDLFVIQLPNKPFGVSWYQSDLQTDSTGAGTVSVRGIFNKETFSISPGGPTVTFGATHQFHLGLWFNNPKVPFNLGCEPGATSPIITPFNGEQNAGVEDLNTHNFPNNTFRLPQISKI